MFKYDCINDAIYFLKDHPNFEYDEKTEQIIYKQNIPPPTNSDIDNIIEKIKKSNKYFWNGYLKKQINDSDIDFYEKFHDLFFTKENPQNTSTVNTESISSITSGNSVISGEFSTSKKNNEKKNIFVPILHTIPESDESSSESSYSINSKNNNIILKQLKENQHTM